MNAAATALWRRIAGALPLVARALLLAVGVVVVVLLFEMGSRIDWDEVFRAMRGISGRTLAAAGALVVTSYAAYSGIDGLARQFVPHSLPLGKTLAIAAVSYAINLNLGVLLGAIGVRLRLYRKLGLHHIMISRVVLFGSVTNWLGYCWLAGFLFLGGPVRPLARWGIEPAAVRAIGAGMLVAALAYLLLCVASRRARWGRRVRRVALPPLRMALAQSVLAIASWGFMGSIVYVLLERQVSYPEVLGILLFCSIAAMIARIPGGLGVTEAIFVAALAGRLPDHQVLAAVLMYRVLYQWVPLCIALPAYAAMEFRSSRAARAARAVGAAHGGPLALREGHVAPGLQPDDPAPGLPAAGHGHENCCLRADATHEDSHERSNQPIATEPSLFTGHPAGHGGHPGGRPEPE